MRFANNMMYNNLAQVIKAPTRITLTTKTIIDHIYVSPDKPLEINSGVLLNKISDHLCTFVNINLSPKKENRKHPSE